MNALHSMLVIVERISEAQVALQKASVVARHFGAMIELFNCDAERNWGMRALNGSHAGELARASCGVDSRRLLEALRGSIAAEDIVIKTSYDCEHTLHEGVERKIAESRPGLVVWCVTTSSEERESRLSAAEWHLIRVCAAPLLLTRRRSWAPQPRLLAAIDLSCGALVPAALAVLDAASHLAEGCEGELDVVVVGTPGEHADAQGVLRRLAGRASGRGGPVDILEGSPQIGLARRVVDHAIDVVVTQGPAATDSNGRLAEWLIAELDCDFLLLPPVADVRGALGVDDFSEAGRALFGRGAPSAT